jgi:hypothetical protein
MNEQFTPKTEIAKKKIWKQPWGYTESFLIALGLMVTGFSIQLVTGNSFQTFEYPVNIVIAVIFINLLIALHLFFGRTALVRWISGVPAAISAMSLMTFQVLILGFTPQTDQYLGLISDLGFTQMITSWPFILAEIFLVASLGLVTLKRTIPFKKKNIGFIFNHAGLFIVLLGASLGAGDLQRYNMNLTVGKDFTDIAYNEKGQFQMRLKMKATRFTIDEYPPKIVIADRHKGNVLDEKGKAFIHSSQGTKGMVANWHVEVLKFLPDAIMDSSQQYIEKKIVGAGPAAFVKAWKNSEKDTLKGWISCGSFMMNFKLLNLDSTYSLAMATPEVKRYNSQVEYSTLNGEKGKIELEVNKPVKVGNWKIYQSGYDQSMGKYSQTSIVEMVNDPWLPIVYLGIFMMLAGAAYIFWIGRYTKNIPTSENESN